MGKHPPVAAPALVPLSADAHHLTKTLPVTGGLFVFHPFGAVLLKTSTFQNF